MEMEPISQEYASFSSPQFRDLIVNLLMKIAKYLHHSPSAVQPNATLAMSPITSSNSLMSSIINFFTIEPTSPNISSIAQAEASKTKNYLESSVRNLSLIFDIHQQSIETIMSSDKGGLQKDADSVDSTIRGTVVSMNACKHCILKNFLPFYIEKNAYEIVNGIPKLSEYGRQLILSGKRTNLPDLVQGNPDEQPVRTFEVAILVKLALFFSLLINKRYEAYFVENYHEHTFIGAILKEVLSPPIKFVRYVKSSNRMATEVVVEDLPPRVNLRFIASMSFIFYLALLLSFARLCNFSIFNVAILLFTIFISYIGSKSMLASIKK